MKFFIKLTVRNGVRLIDGCTTDRQYADENWGQGSYYAVYAANEQDVDRASIEAGFTDDTSLQIVVENAFGRDKTVGIVEFCERWVSHAKGLSGLAFDEQQFNEINAIVHRVGEMARDVFYELYRKQTKIVAISEQYQQYEPHETYVVGERFWTQGDGCGIGTVTTKRKPLSSGQGVEVLYLVCTGIDKKGVGLQKEVTLWQVTAVENDYSSIVYIV